VSGLGLVYPHQDRFTLSDGRYLVGAVVASLFGAMFSELRHIGKSMIASVIVWHASILVFATSQSFYLSMAILAVTGAGFASTPVFMLSSLLGNSRSEFRGRVMSLRS
jgi:MFS family permease